MKTSVRIPTRFSESHHRGFTVIELMVTIAVLSILLGLGVPAFGDIVRSNQISAASADLVTALTLARSEAMKRGVRVSVCAAAAQDTCSDDTNWSNGWIVFTDDFGAAGVIDAGDSSLQIWTAPATGVTVAMEAQRVSFTRQARAEAAARFIVSKQGCSVNQQRAVDVSVSGAVDVTRQDCG